ncbi:uncharacterized protein [Procambarus clarkii]|uniref:uncharacterized protein n=1 Tax=Procambarus clarkii TaxID=6728 RepID=UPI0037436FE8
MLTYRRPVLVLQLLLAAASTTSPATFIEGGCYRDAVQSPWVSMSGGHYSPEGLTPDICKNFCGRLHFWYCAADEGRYCYCLQKLGTLVAASGLCTAVCVDGSECGGSTPGLLTLWQTSVLTGHLNLTLNANTSLFPVGATVSVTVNATSSWVTNWGDGSIYITNGTNHTYTIPGEYTVVAFLELVPGVMDGATVTVVSKPNGTLNCPAHVTVGEAAVCPLITSTQGYGSVLNTTYTEPGMPQTSYHIPEEVSRVYGSILNVAAPAGTPRLLKTPTALTLHSEGVHAGYLAAVRVMATTPGWLSLYANHNIERKGNVKDLGILMSEDLTFKEHNKVAVTTARKMTAFSNVSVGFPRVATDGMIVATDDMIVATDNMIVATDNMIVPTDDMIVPTDDMIVPTDDMIVPTDDMIVPTDDMIVATDNMIVATADIIVATGSERRLCVWSLLQ